MQYILYPPKNISFNAALPASKSISNRALAINALTGSTVHPDNLSRCDDTDVMVDALRDMPYEINIKAAGTAMRFLTALLCTRDGEHVITGTERMRHRPIGVLVDALRKLGADIEYTGEEGFPPLRIRGKQLEGGKLEIPGNISSQYISALLMAAPKMTRGLELRMTGTVFSRPYIDLTVCTMREFGAEIEWADASTIRVEPKQYTPTKFFVENDWSAASYWYEVIALMSHTCADADADMRIDLDGLMDGSRQGDSAVRYIFSLLGVKTEFDSREALTPTHVTLIPHHRRMPRLDYDFTGQPDLAQTIVVTAALLGVPFTFSGLYTLRIKETDRITALKKEMAKLGYVIDDSVEGTLSWDGTRCEPMTEPVIDTYEDHRMAMAFAPAAIMIPGLRINNPGVVTKSYPDFWQQLAACGFNIEENPAS